MFAFGVGGNVLFMSVVDFGLCVGEDFVFNGLGRNGDRGGGEMKLEVLICSGDGGCGLEAFALYVVDGRGNVERSPCDGDGACDNRRPICTVAEDAIDESLLWPRDPGPNIAGGGVKSLMSYIEVGSCCREVGTESFAELSCSTGKREYDAFRVCARAAGVTDPKADSVFFGSTEFASGLLYRVGISNGGLRGKDSKLIGRPVSFSYPTKLARLLDRVANSLGGD